MGISVQGDQCLPRCPVTTELPHPLGLTFHGSALLHASVISTFQPVDQHLSAASLATVSQLITNCQPLD